MKENSNKKKLRKIGQDAISNKAKVNWIPLKKEHNVSNIYDDGFNKAAAILTGAWMTEIQKVLIWQRCH